MIEITVGPSAPALRSSAMSLPRVRASITVLVCFSLVTLVACELPIHPRDGSAVVQIRIAPDSVALDPSQTQGFVASGRTAGGDSMAVDVTWTTSAGTITPAGVYTADTGAADAIITATLVGSQVSGVALVRKRRVAQIILSPAAVSLRTGGTQQFAAWGVRNTGDSVGVAVTYSATGGTITSGGLFTAGQTAGSFRVVARLTNGLLADTAAVTVTSEPPPRKDRKSVV